MSNNLVALALQYLTPEVIARIASVLGLDRAMVEKAITAAVPTLFGALAGTAQKPEGANRIADALKKLDPDVISGLGSAFAGGKQDMLIDSGRGLLSSLLGGKSGTLADAVGKFGHLNSGAASSLLAAVTPVVLGTIKKDAPSLDAGSLAGLLAGQKDNIAAALPTGLSSVLAKAGLIDEFNKTSSPARQTAERASKSAIQPGAPPGLAKLAWILPLVAIAALAWYFFGQPAEKPAVPPAPDVVQVDGVDIGKEVAAVSESLKTSLGGITDAAAAQAALPQLTEASARVDKMTELVGKLTPEQKKVVAGLVAAVLPTLTGLADKVLVLPGVGDIIKPTLDGLGAKLEALAKA